MNPFIPKIKSDETKPEARNVLTRLPSFLQQHDDVERFFKGVLNHFFEPAEVEEISGFVGRRSTVFDPNDFYVQEATSARQNYQLEPSAVSVSSEDNIEYYRFYEDLVDNLRVQGALTNNHSRLFESEFWSWCPPINPDMLVNFSNYYWLEEGPPAIEITESTNVVLEMIGRDAYTFPDGTKAQSGQRVIFRDDANTEYNDKNFLLVNVGREIALLDDSEFDSASETTQDYIVMERGARDQNQWSSRNRWFHRNQISNVDLTNFIVVQARRPVIQFEANVQLRNMGRTARLPVDLKLNGPLSSVQGKSTVTVDGVLVSDGMRILVTGETSASQNNAVYRVTGHSDTGIYILVKEADGQNNDGSPYDGEVIRIRQGILNSDKRVYWNGSSWVDGQAKTQINQYPLFELYDLDGVSLDDEGTYPSSTFSGSSIFGFKENDANPVDSYLGLRISFNSFGEIIYNNFIQSESHSYITSGVSTVIPGMKFFRINGAYAISDQYESDWRNPGWLSRQSVSDTWQIKQRETSDGTVEFPREYMLSQTPEPEQDGQFQTFRVFLNGNLLNEGLDYSRTGDKLNLSLTLSLADNDFLDARSFDRDRSDSLAANGYYRIPSNLQANPNNDVITEISYNEMFEHFITIIENQQGIEGRPYGINNYNSTARNLAAGTEIVQHSSPLLRLMFLNQNKEFNIRNAIRFSALEYQKWFSKVQRTVKRYIDDGQLDDFTDADALIDYVIAEINLGRDSSFPFKNSGMIGDGLFIPASPAYLGFGIVSLPEEFIDTTITDRTVKWRRGHDGSLTQVTGIELDTVMLQLEQRIYKSIDPSFKNVHPEFSHFDVMPGKYRSSAYSSSEWNKVMRPHFEQWAVQNGVDHRPNTWYDSTDPFTFNYRRSPDRNGETVPGHWRGMYRYYFDTDRPHTHPWEMLGLGEKPSWWNAEYGEAPYTRENTEMWTDLENGVIAGGDRAGIDQRFVRPGLKNVIPVDAAGNLLNPIACGIIPSAPGASFASADFVFGDVSPVEWIWRISSQYPFDLASTTYLCRPAEWIEKTWDSVDINRHFRDQINGQLVYAPTGQRRHHTDGKIHTSTNREIGSQQWVSEYWLSKGLDPVTYLETMIANLTTRLGYRTGAFINVDGTRVTADNFGLVPAEDITTVLSQSASRREPVYSALIVRWDGSNYRVKGYDSLFPTLNYVKPIGSKTTFTFGNTSASFSSKFGSTVYQYEYDTPLPTLQDVVDLITGYGAWLESEGWIFDEYLSGSTEINDWRRMAKEFIRWANDPLTDDEILYLSPYATTAAFQSEFGLVDKVTQYTNGTWTALDYEGIPMRTDSFAVARVDNQVTVTHNNPESLAFLRLTVIEYDHALIFKNQTKFGNLIYDPKINLRQRRFRVIGSRVKFWNGRFDAPGYLIQNDTIIPNYDTRAEDIRKFYDPYAFGASSEAFKHARHLVGYRKKAHMQDMLLDDRSQFNFFRGFLQEKGTTASFDRLLRSTYVRNSQSDFQVLEEWALKVGEYGAKDTRSSLEFALLQSDIKSDPQTVTFTTDSSVTDSKLDQVITIPLTDDRWIRTASSRFANTFSLRNFSNILGKDLPTAGWVQLGETDYIAADETSFRTLWEDKSRTLSEGSDVWVIKDDKGDWDVRRFGKITRLVKITEGEEATDPVTIRTFDAHNLMVGDVIVLVDSTGTTPDYKDTQIVSAVVNSYTFQLATPATIGKSWTTTATNDDQSPVTYYGRNLVVNSTNILFITTTNNTFSSSTGPQNLGGLTLTVDGDSVTFSGNTVTGLQTNPKLRSTDTSTSMTLEGYPVLFEHTNIVGTVISPTVTVGGTTGIYINGTDVVWTGAGNLDSIIADINGAGISRIFADRTGTGNTQLRIWNLGDEDIVIRNVGIVEDALEELGFAFNTSVTGTNTSPTVTVDASNGININGTAVVFTGAGDAAAIVNDITTAAISSISASVVSGAVQITHSSSGDIYLYNVDSAEDSVEVIGFTRTDVGKTTSDYVSVINLAVDTDDIEASVVSSRIQLEKKNGGSITIVDEIGTPSVSFGLQKSYAARTTTQIVAEMVSSGIPATLEADTSILFTFAASDVVAVSGTATTVLELESEYRAVVSFAEVNSQISAAVIPNVTFSSSNGYLSFENLSGSALTFSGSAVDDLGFDSTYIGGSTGPDLFGWTTLRRRVVTDVGTSAPALGWTTGDKNFVDPDTETNLSLPNTGNNRWSVYSYNGSVWIQERYQLDRIDTPSIESVFLFDRVSNQTLSQISVWDPVKKIIPGTAMSEIYYTLEIDPAVYNAGNDDSVVQNADSAWGIAQVGRLWWDLNAVRYLDYEQGDLSYRRKYWGRKLPGSSIDIYEWTRSPVPPSEWNTYVSQQAENANSSYLPSGTVKNPDNPVWVTSVEFDKQSQQNKTFYYFWTLNPKFRPNKPFRKKSAFEVKTIINDPFTSGVIFFSPIATSTSAGLFESSFIVGNITNIVTNDDVILQVNLRKRPDEDKNIHKEWALIREDSDDLVEPSIWKKMRDSLIGEDDYGYSVPDLSLNDSRRYGIQIRPRQSMFADRERARRAFVAAANRLLSAENIVDNDPNWETTFLAKDPEPSADFTVTTREERDSLASNPLFESGMTVLVTEDEVDDNKWSHWSWDGASFTLLDKEEYDMQNYWEYIDWYDSSSNANLPPTTVYSTLSTRDSNSHLNGEVVLVTNNGEGRWIWTKYNDNGTSTWWNTVAIKQGTISINSRLYEFNLGDSDLELEGKIATGKLIDYFDE
jgi:hypothetical protein